VITRRPALSILAAVYLAGLALLCLTPNTLVARGVAAGRRVLPGTSGATVEFTIDALLFVPVGVLVVLIVGRRRWLGVVMFGIVAACWLQLGAMVWLAEQPVSSRPVLAHITGCIAGVAIVLLVVGVRRAARAHRPVTALTPISQSNASRL
jgi:hypothetical protein